MNQADRIRKENIERDSMDYFNRLNFDFREINCPTLENEQGREIGEKTRNQIGSWEILDGTSIQKSFIFG